MVPMVLPAATPQEWIARHLHPFLAHDVPVADTSVEWYSLQNLLADDWHQLRNRHHALAAKSGQLDTAAMYLVGWTASPVASAVGFMLAFAGAGMRVDPANLRLRFHNDGWPVQVDVGEPEVVVAADHPWAALPGVRVASDASVVVPETIADLIELARPFVDACKSFAKVGRVGLWNEVADAIGCLGLYRLDLPTESIVLERIDQMLHVAGAPWKSIADVRIAQASFGDVYLGRKGGCCLAYKTEHRGSSATPDQLALCSTCSLRDLPDVEARQLVWLEREHAARVEKANGS